MYNREATIARAEALVREKMASYDPSHDALHVWRVRRLALKIAETELARNNNSDNPESIDLDVVELAALFHDLQDHKYVTPAPEATDPSTKSARPAAAQTTSEEMLQIMTEGGLDERRAELVFFIIKNTSYSTEKKLRAANPSGWTERHIRCRELHCVQDADRLDAIGTFGLFRAAAYSGAIDRPLYVFEDDSINAARTAAELPHYQPGDNGLLPRRKNQDAFSSYQHFHDKLLTLKDLMKTETGRIVGQRRHAIMAAAIEAMDTEFDLADFP
ncbi:hypothetical protein D0Z00_002341 [Geotrichum galactomycetum]|uniref:Uncharacterized protein n=1 Tax=Geotrichum galactomycetum TaxID=27317 RepID=A0ACB6V4C5_9ASCO|nr:hypothetical protein D0Z00_002341 [Geotrichum candidum]